MGKSDDIKAVEVRAEVRSIRTCVDGTVSIVLNIPEDCREQVKWLLDLQGLEVRCVIENPDNA
jgi:hypothetical protein